MIYRDYDKIKAINNSRLSALKRSPLHFQYAQNNPVPTSQVFYFGQAFHIYVLENEKFEKDVFVLDDKKKPIPDKDYKTKINRDWKEDQIYLASKNNQAIISGSEFETIKIMRDRLEDHQLAWELINYTRNKYESIREWKHNGTKCKCLLDISNDIFLADLKTDAGDTWAGGADPDKFQRSFFKYDYHRQAGMYSDGDAGGEINFSALKIFYYIVIEKLPPYAVAVYKCTPSLIENGVREYRRLVDLYAKCKKRNKWPGYEVKSIMGEAFKMELPSWM